MFKKLIKSNDCAAINAVGGSATLLMTMFYVVKEQWRFALGCLAVSDLFMIFFLLHVGYMLRKREER